MMPLIFAVEATEREQIGFTKIKSTSCLNTSGELFKRCVYDASLLICNNLAGSVELGDIFFDSSSLDLYNRFDRALSFSFYESAYSCHAGFNPDNSYLSASIFKEMDFN